MDRIRIIVLAGPTASGKTSAAIQLARRLGGEIVSADSMQIYKYMDIGSAKPTAEERRAAVHYLVDEIDPAEPFSVAEYRKMAGEYIRRIAGSGKVPIVEGGTGLYVNSIVYDMDFGNRPADRERRDELKRMAERSGKNAVHDLLRQKDPEAAERIHPNNLVKVIRAIEAAESGTPIPSFEKSFSPSSEFEPLMFGLNRDRQKLYERIDLRVDLMMEAGLVDEVKGLLKRGLSVNDISMKGIGYKEVVSYINGECGREEMTDNIKRGTRRFAKRQMTWFRRYPDMIWYDITDGDGAAIEDMCRRAAEFMSDPDR